MQKILVLLLAAALAICLAACGVASVPAGGAVPETFAGAETDDQPDETAPAEREQLVTGTVVYYDSAMLAVCTHDHANLNFLVADGEVDKNDTSGLLAGSEVDVHYTGQINGGNTAAARVTRLAQSAEQAAANVGVAGGIIVSADASALNILSFDGEALTFSIASGDIDMTHTGGLPADAYVTVFYEGEISGGAEAVRVLKIVQQ